jgi:SagB-type dehydrogenase family enzyme
MVSGKDRTMQDPLAVVMRYHEETKHHFSHFARALGHLDWVNQPDPFRRYAGAARAALPRLEPDAAPRSPAYDALYRAGAVASVPVGMASLSRLFEHSLAITAWKQAGTVRWALRANPSSGNLHPTEAYLLIGDVGDIAPGLYHYAPREHALEHRCDWTREGVAALLQGFPPNAFIVGFASVNWRETWKYGERAFRYCQHDVGHAIAAVRIAAQALGWRMLLLDGTSDDTVAALLGIDRAEDFAGAEREHPDGLALVWPDDPTVRSLPLSLRADAMPLGWHGHANRLSRGDPLRWEIIDAVESASWKSSTEDRRVDWQPEPAQAPRPNAADARARAGQLIHQRRSALAFDGKTSLSAGSFFTMLARVMPRAERGLSRRPMPWDAVPWEPAIHLALFVHRVDGLAPGLYLLLRDSAKRDALQQSTHPPFDWTRPSGCPADLPLFFLQGGDARALAAQLSCGQEIAGDSAFSLGMIAEFEPRLRRDGAWFYRRLFWETGLIGQVLYLEAEAVGLRATGIGCFFDDPVHEVMGFADASFQSLYHFTTGGAVDDPRLTTLPPYELDH